MKEQLYTLPEPNPTPPQKSEELYTLPIEPVSLSEHDVRQIIGDSLANYNDVLKLNVRSTGYIRGGQTDYNTGTGFFLGYSGAAYKFSIGNASTNYLTWNGTTLSVGGTITATAGTFGSWTISGNTFNTTANNIIIGTNAGTAITSATGNLMIGNGAGGAITSGINNTLLGSFAGNAITTSPTNVYIGLNSGYNTTTSIGANTFIGGSAGYSNTTGASNTALGNAAGYTNTTNSNSVFLGATAGYYETGANKLFIDNATRASEADGRTKALIYGIFGATTDAQQLTINAWYTWIGATRVSTQFDKTSNTTLANVTGLSVTVAAGNTYQFEAILYTTSNVAGGVKFAIAGTATATAIVYEAIVTDAAVLTAQTRATALATAVGGVTAVTAALARITGLITVNAGGTLTVQFAQNASNATASSVLVGSTFTVTNVT